MTLSKATVFIASFALFSSSFVVAQQPDPQQMVDFTKDTCGAPNGGPASVATLRDRLGSELPNFAMFCLIYADAWQRGFDLGIAEGNEARNLAWCQASVRRIAAGESDQAREQAKITKDFPDTWESAVVAQTCANYQSAFSDGVKLAALIVNK